MEITHMSFLRVPEEMQSATGYVARLFADIEEAPAIGIPLTASLGGQPLEGFGVVQSLAPVVSGYLKTLPQVGDELVIKIGSVSIPTGLMVEDPEIFA